MLRNDLTEKIENHRRQFLNELEERLNERWQSDDNPTRQYVNETDQYRVRPESEPISSVFVSHSNGEWYVASALSRFEDGQIPLSFSYDVVIDAPSTFSDLCFKGVNNLFAKMPGSKRTELPFKDADNTHHEKNLARARAIMTNVDAVIDELKSHQYVKTAYAGSGRFGVFHQIIHYKLHVEFDAKCFD